MKCHTCQRPVAKGLEERKRIEARLDPGEPGKVRFYGKGAPDGPLESARGQLVTVQHSKCYWAVRRAAERAAAQVRQAASGVSDELHLLSGEVLAEDRVAELVAEAELGYEPDPDHPGRLRPARPADPR